ncbi:MAG TPA: L,D-transpeptidase family protein [Humisphaera sp.]|nr:L,D-transpeptidase family protein [Humisphaera sp.]
MSRSHHYRAATRISRPLIAALGVTVVLGGFIYFHNHKPKAAAAGQAVAPIAKPIVVAAPINPSDVAPSNAVTSNGVTTVTGSGSTTTTGAGSLVTPNSSTLVTQTPMTGAPPTPSAVTPNTSDKSSNAPVVAIAAPPTSGSVPLVKPGPVNPRVSAASLADGKAKLEAGDILGARTTINDALLSGQLSESDSSAAREMLTTASQKLVFGGKHIDGDTFTERYQVMSGDRLSRIADRHGVTWELLCKINGLPDPKRVRAGQAITLINGPFHAVVNKSKFRLDVYLGGPSGAGSVFVMSLPVGLGKDNSTPTGMWVVQQGNKAHPATYYSPRGEGVIAADDPRNPLGGFWMGIAGVEGDAVGKSSYGIHGTIEPDSIGKQASMGCIRLRHDDIAALFDLLVEGKSKVLIKD